MINGSATTTGPSPVNVALLGKDPNGLSLTCRIVSQAINGTVAITGNTATYLRAAGFKGTDTFTFAAFDGKVGPTISVVDAFANL